MRQLVGPILFMLSAGLFFNDRERRNVTAVAVAGCLAIIATYFTIEQLLDRIVAHLSGTQKTESEVATAFITVVGSVLAAAVGAVIGAKLTAQSDSNLRQESANHDSRQETTTGSLIPSPASEIRPSVPSESSKIGATDRSRVEAVVLPLSLLLGWEFCSFVGLLDKSALPAPSSVLAALTQLLSPGTYLRGIWIFILQVILFTGISYGIAFPLLLCTNRSALLRRLVFWAVGLVGSVPPITMLLPALLALGLGLKIDIVLAVVSAVWLLYDLELCNHRMQASNSDTTISRPELPTTKILQNAVVMAVGTVAATDMFIGLSRGIGFSLWTYQHIGNGVVVVSEPSRLLAGILIVSLISTMFVTALHLAQRMYCKWRGPKFGFLPTSGVRNTRYAVGAVVKNMFVAAGGVGFLIVGWGICAQLRSNDLLLPGPQAVLYAWVDYLKASLARDLGATGGCVLAAFGVAALSSLILHAVSSKVPSLQAFVMPSIRAMGMIPAVCWVPLVNLWFGFGYGSEMLAASAAATLATLRATVADAAELRGWPKVQARIAVGAALNAAVWFEIVAGAVALMTKPNVLANGNFDGLAYRLIESRSGLETPTMFACIVTIGMLSIVAYVLSGPVFQWIDNATASVKIGS